jgi:acyl carrier protein
MTAGLSPDRGEVIAMLATYGDRRPEQVRDKLDSLEVAWLIHQVEQRYQAELDLDDDQILQMSTVDGAVAMLAKALRP